MIIFILSLILCLINAYFVIKSMISVIKAKKRKESVFNRHSHPIEVRKSPFSHFLILKRYLTVKPNENALDYKASCDMKISYFLMIYLITFGSILNGSDSKFLAEILNIPYEIVVVIMFGITAALTGHFFQKSKKDDRVFNRFFKKSALDKKLLIDLIKPTLDFGKWFALAQYFAFSGFCFLLKFFFVAYY